MNLYAKYTSMFIIKAKYICSTASFIKVITSHISWGLLLYYLGFCAMIMIFHEVIRNNEADFDVKVKSLRRRCMDWFQKHWKWRVAPNE